MDKKLYNVSRMYTINFAATRCEEKYDISLNDLLGRVVY